MGPRAIKTTSHPAAISRLFSFIRIDSRIRRLIRLRTTAFPIRRPMAKPKRLYSRPLGRTDSTNRGWAQVRPSRRRRAKSAFARRRFFLRMTSLAGGPTPHAGRSPFYLYGQAMATLPSPSLEDSASPLGFHPSPKAVHALAAADLGLPRSFRHSNTSPIKITTHNYTFFSH